MEISFWPDMTSETYWKLDHFLTASIKHSQIQWHTTRVVDLAWPENWPPNRKQKITYFSHWLLYLLKKKLFACSFALLCLMFQGGEISITLNRSWMTLFLKKKGALTEDNDLAFDVKIKLVWCCVQQMVSGHRPEDPERDHKPSVVHWPLTSFPAFFLSFLLFFLLSSFFLFPIQGTY